VRLPQKSAGGWQGSYLVAKAKYPWLCEECLRVQAFTLIDHKCDTCQNSAGPFMWCDECAMLRKRCRACGGGF